MSKPALNPAFDRTAFLQHEWQQKPLLIRQFIPGFTDAVSPEELAGLACEDWIESRLIRELQPGRWSVSHGPFPESEFQQLPEENWTVLVQAVDQWLDPVAELKPLFDFIPQWRIEDVMVSFAADGGGVGPHYDQYDVFLVQGSGQRLWQIGDRVAADTELDNQDGVGILRDFVAREEFILQPGDALYVPPQFAHWGRSIGDSTCYSVGLRAPSMAEMLEGFSDHLSNSWSPGERFTDARPVLPRHPARLEPASLAASFAELQARFAAPVLFTRWFGCNATQPKYPELRDAPATAYTESSLLQELAAGKRLYHHSGSRFAFSAPEGDSPLFLFVDGEAIALPAPCTDLVAQLCLPAEVTALETTMLSDNDTVLAVVRHLLNQGSLLLH